MKHLKTMMAVAMGAICYQTNAQTVLSVSDVKLESSNKKVTVSIAVDFENEVSSFSLDMNIPAGCTYKSCTPTLNGILYEYDEDFEEYSTLPVVIPEVTQKPSCVRILFNSTTKKLPANNQASTEYIQVVFLNTPQTVLTAEDFTFNNVNGSNLGVREECAFPIGKLGANGYSSFASEQDVVITGATANYGVLEGGVLTLNAVDGAVKNKQGVILKGTEGNMVYGKSVATADTPEKNDLLASINTGVNVDPSENIYVLATKAEGTGLYPFVGSYIKAGKAYLKNGSGARIAFDTENGIEAVNAEQNVQAIFNLQGQKMTEAKKGINIVNGKKVMF